MVKSKDIRLFDKDYQQELDSVVSRVQAGYKSGRIEASKGSAEITSHMDSWLKSHSGEYGFKYTSNW